MQIIKKGEGKALGQVSANSFFESSDVCEGCGVKKPKTFSIFIPAEQYLVQIQLILTNKSI